MISSPFVLNACNPLESEGSRWLFLLQNPPTTPGQSKSENCSNNIPVARTLCMTVIGR